MTLCSEREEKEKRLQSMFRYDKIKRTLRKNVTRHTKDKQSTDQ